MNQKNNKKYPKAKIGSYELKRICSIVVYGMIVFTALSAPAVFSQETLELDTDLTVREIQPGAYLVTHTFPWPANSLLAELGDSTWLLVDTPWTNQASEKLYDWISERGELKAVINTHHHRDNLGGNGFFIAKSVSVYGSDLTVELLKKHIKEGDPTLENDSERYESYFKVFRETPLVPPNFSFPLKEGLWLDFGRKAEIYFPGAGHTADNVVVYLPDRRILFGGCLVRAAGSTTLGYTGAADLAAWPGSLRKLLERYPECQTVIPGHGQPGDKLLFEHTLHLLENFGN
ncbi:MBL fold metallo-hydrolase [candidate division KSB1 bacterium]|nr:MBL fold metallo-hydrolase [candidate division KSB1 bacterium]